MQRAKQVERERRRRKKAKKRAKDKEDRKNPADDWMVEHSIKLRPTRRSIIHVPRCDATLRLCEKSRYIPGILTCLKTPPHQNRTLLTSTLTADRFRTANLIHVRRLGCWYDIAQWRYSHSYEIARHSSYDILFVPARWTHECEKFSTVHLPVHYTSQYLGTATSSPYGDRDPCNSTLTAVNICLREIVSLRCLLARIMITAQRQCSEETAFVSCFKMASQVAWQGWRLDVRCFLVYIH